ncbi:MAG TPA: DinB family protein [Anaerolineales bacterium]
MSAVQLDFPALYLELIDSTEMIRALVAGITPEEARIKPAADSWSIIETLCHLFDEERLDFRARLEATLNRPEQAWEPIDPQGWVTARKYNEQDINDIKRRFLAERSKSLDWLKGLENRDWRQTHTSQSGSMSAGDLLASWVAHDNLTVRQLVELRRHRLERICRPFSIAYAGDW